MLFIGDTTPPRGALLIHAEMVRLNQRKGSKPLGVPCHTIDFEGPQEPDGMVRELEVKGIKVENIRMHGNGPG
jgi:hypothetical protein